MDQMNTNDLDKQEKEISCFVLRCI